MDRERTGRARFWSQAVFPLGIAVVIGAWTLPVIGPNSAPRTHVVEVRGFEYVPERVDAAPGDTIVWVNRDMVAHPATGRDTAWDSGSMATDATWRQVVRREGRTPYVCVFHPDTTGTIVVR